MAENSAISWTNHTFNPWWGCWKIAPECANCYADSTAHRYVSQFGELWGRTSPRRFFGDHHWNEPHKWNRRALEAGVRERVFVGSMCDWAEIHPDPVIREMMKLARDRLFHLIAECTGLDWLLLTKRIEDVADHALLPWLEHPTRENEEPWSHVWLMTTAGTIDAVRNKVPVLRSIPAAVRGISCEPLLEHIPREVWDLALAPFGTGPIGTIRPDDGGVTRPHTGIDWLIVGDESGHHRRPAQADWIRTAREAALAHRVAFHFKQWNGPEAGGVKSPTNELRKPGRKIHLPMLDGRQWAQFPR